MFNWISFLTYAVVTAVTPGPNNILSMSNGNRKGFRGALPFNFGILVGFSAVMLLCTAFCSLLSAWIPKIKLPMLIIGAAYMLYLAWETVRSSGVAEEDDSRDCFRSGQQQSKSHQRKNASMIVRKNIGLHGHDAVDIDLGIDKLEKQAGKESAAGRNFFYLSSAFYGFPGQVQHIGSS